MRLKKNLQSYRFAIKGIRYLIRFENNFRIQLICAFLVIAIGIIYQIPILAWTVFIVLIGVVLMAEAFNTALEKLADKIEPGYDKEIGAIKDIAAGAVLLISAAALIAGLLILFNFQ